MLCVVFGTSSWVEEQQLVDGTVYMYQVEVRLAATIFQEGEDLPQPYTKCCVLFFELIAGRRATTG